MATDDKVIGCHYRDNMIQSFIHTSDNANLYFHEDQYRLSVLVHPEFKKAYEGSTDADPYYQEKYSYLKYHGFFAKPKIAVFRTMEESAVRENIINTKQIVFEATDSCNLNCMYCVFGEMYEGFDERSDDKINTRNAIKLLK